MEQTHVKPGHESLDLLPPDQVVGAEYSRASRDDSYGFYQQSVFLIRSQLSTILGGDGKGVYLRPWHRDWLGVCLPDVTDPCDRELCFSQNTVPWFLTDLQRHTTLSSSPDMNPSPPLPRMTVFH